MAPFCFRKDILENFQKGIYFLEFIEYDYHVIKVGYKINRSEEQNNEG